ncbi:MAG TPA: response regulator transcription factor [Candidatus Acidoferrales bacterium]|jgi:DNA-binding NarL/FixJ family response regulator|nr:response regulator transcription factor [Candidatus Acidoferrales bacterium]
MATKIKVLLVDDHPLVREGLVNLINQQPDLEICGEAGNEVQALELISQTRPDVAVVDISLETGSGIELLKNIKAYHPAVKSLVLSMHDEGLYAERALHAGARGYIMKREAAKKVIAGIQAVHAGQLYVSEKIAAVMAEKFVGGKSSANASPIEALSDRELQVFELLGQGQSTRQISENLHVGFKTVQAYQARIKEKLQLANASELMRAAIRWNETKQAK